MASYNKPENDKDSISFELGLCCFVGDFLRSFCFGMEVVFNFCRNRKTWERTGDAFWSMETSSELI